MTPSSLPALLLLLGRAAGELGTHPSHPARLRHRPATVPAARLDGLRRYRPEIIALLTLGHRSADPEGTHAVEERLGMADELGLPTHPGSAAWLIAVAESMEETE